MESGEVLGRFALALVLAASVAVSVFACWAGGGDFLLLVSDCVLRPPDVSLMVWALDVLGCAGSLVLLLFRRRARREGHLAGGAVIGGLVAVVLLGTGVWCVGRVVVVEGLAGLGPNAYTVLRAPAASGCTVVAQETGELRSSYGHLYAVGLLGYARPAGSWRADEIQLPVRDGDYSLQWDGEVGTLVLSGRRGIWPDRLQVSCTSQRDGENDRVTNAGR